MVIGIDASRANVAERTGTERYAWEVIRRLLPLLHSHQVRLYVREPLRSDWGPLGDQVQVRVLRWPPAVLWSHLRLSWELLWHHPDVLFVPADTVPLIHPPTTITTIHDVAFERFPELYRSASVQRRLGWLRPLIHTAVRLFTLGRYGASERDYHRWSVRHALRTCSRILTVSEFTKSELVQTLKADPDRITVTYLGVRQPETYAALGTEQRRKTLERLCIPKPFFLYLGRLEKKKNILGVLAAYSRLVQTHGAATIPDLVLVGSPGYGWAEAQPVAERLRSSGKLHILGWTTDEDVMVLQTSAVALIYLSWYEGFGIPAVESLSAGVPVLAARVGSLPEVLGAAAFLVDPNDTEQIVSQMFTISTDQALRQRLIHLGLERVRNYTWERTSTATASILISRLQKLDKNGTVSTFNEQR